MTIRAEVIEILKTLPDDTDSHRVLALERIVSRLAGELDLIRDDLDWHGVVEQSHRGGTS